MTAPDVDSELERLLSQTRAETEPAPDARARIRAVLDQRLAAAPAPSAGRAKLLTLAGAGVLAIGAGIWLTRSQPPEPAPRVVTSAPVAPSAVVVPAPSMELEPPPTVPSTSASAAKALPRVAATASDPAAEIRLIAAMQAALRAGKSAEALALAEQHAKSFPRGALVQEREGVRAVARCRVAEPSARSALGQAFLARYPGSPYAARVKDACR